MGVFDTDIASLAGPPLDVAALRGKAVLVVNVASRCGLTPQYTALEQLQQRFGDRGFTVLGAPCNQFAAQEPDAADAIATFCSATYGTTFPMTEKLDVNGRRRHRLYDALTAFPDADGVAGDVEWNFEKFLVSRSGEVLARFRPLVAPDADEVVAAIEAALTAAEAPAPAWETVPAADVRVGERVRPHAGLELTVSRVQPAFFGNDELLAFVEDTAEQWLKVPTRRDAVVEVLRPHA